MRVPLEQSVLAAIQTSRMLAAGNRVGVAVSGGADSVALLRLLHRLRNELGITLAVVHFNHALRGTESEADAAFVAELAHALELEFLAAREDVAAEAARQGWNLEDAARRLRYAFFQRVISERQATNIAVAHTADDQAETVLAHLMRGTGPTGLAGIYPVAGTIVRPLLGTRRESLREYLRANSLPWREDSTNRDLRRTRARIREQLLPTIERDFSGAIVDHLSELARFAREEGNLWDALVEDRIQAFAQPANESIGIAVHALLTPLALRTPSPQNPASPKYNEFGPLRVLTERLIRRLYEVVRGNRRELGADHVEQVLHLASGSSSGHHVELPGGIIVRRNFGELIFSRSETIRQSNGNGTARKANAYQYVVTLPLCETATVSIPELGKCFRLKVIDWPLTESDTKSYANALDADLLRSPLILRNWRPGDAYRPQGRRHELKLKSMFLAGRVPSGDRTVWPVLESGGRVIWAQGMPAAEDFRARDITRAGVVIEEEGLESGRVS
ncbi:MAG TPA: tRNA lysidine(34) synthetase TilS [Candidatus Acidoferrales bacterium]